MSYAVLSIKVYGVTATDPELADEQVNYFLDQLSKADTTLQWDEADWHTVNENQETN